MLPKRAPRSQGVGLAARTAGAATLGMRGPSRGAAAAALNRTLAAVDARIVGVLSQEGTPADLSPRLELALLVNIRRSLQGQLAVAADDVVLCDSVVEFADGIPPLLADLQAGGKRRLRRMVEYSRELLTQVVALGGTGIADMKAQVLKIRAVLDQLPEDDAPDDKLKPAAKETLALYKRVCEELDRRSPRTTSSMLDGMTKI